MLHMRQTEVGGPRTRQAKSRFVRKPHSFEECQITETHTVIAHLDRKDSLFFQCYSDELYDQIYEDLQNHY